MSKVAKQMYQAISGNIQHRSEIPIGKIRDCKALQLLRLDQIKIINSKKVINLQSIFYSIFNLKAGVNAPAVERFSKYKRRRIDFSNVPI